MKKNFTLFKVLLVAIGLMGGVSAWADEVVVPTPVYSNSFESETERAGVTIVGNGVFEDDANEKFGKIFHNDPSNTSAIRTNYLLLPSNVFSFSSSKTEMTIGFWVNKKSEDDYYWTSLFSAQNKAPYEGTLANNTTGLVNDWTMFNCLTREWLIYNLNEYNGGWSDFTDAQNDAGTNTASPTWLDDGDWHYYTVVLTTSGAKVYIDGTNVNSWTFDATGFFNTVSNLTYVCLGGNQYAAFADADPAFGFDDFAVYDVALSAEQIQSIVTSKVGQHAWSAKAYATINNVKTEIDTWTGSNVMEGATYNVWAKRVIQHGGQYYELDDNKFFGSSTSFGATMGTADVEYEISYTLNEDIVYYSEGEVFGQNTASETASGGAYCNYYAGPTTVSGLTANQVYRLETNVVGRNDNSSLEIYQTEGTTSFAKIDKHHGTGYNTIYFTPTETSVRVGGPYYSDKFQNSLSFDYILIRKYDIVNPAGILGTLDKASSWTQSAAYTLKQGETKVFTFKNHGYGVDNSSERSWYNWIVYMYEGETSKAETRADFWDNKKGDNLGYQAMSTDGGSTRTWVDWSKFREDMDDAVVVATLTYQDGTYSISAESTAAKSGYIYYVNHSVTDLTGDLTIKISIDHSWMEMLSVESNLVTATIGSTGYTTFSSSYPLDLTDIEAYYIASVGSDKAMLTKAPGTVAAGTGLILAGTAGDVISIPVADSGDAIDGNLLVGCPTATEVDTPNDNVYVLVNNDGAEFQPLSGTYTNNKVTIPAGKAYLNAPGLNPVSGNANLRVVFAGDATGIANIEAAKAKNGAMFNMAGQRVNGSYKGIVIKNGKKVLVK